MRTSMCPIAMAPTTPLSCFNGRTSRIVMLDKNSLAPIEKIGAPLAAERRQTARSDLIVNQTDRAVDFNRFPNSFHDNPPYFECCFEDVKLFDEQLLCHGVCNPLPLLRKPVYYFCIIPTCRMYGYRSTMLF